MENNLQVIRERKFKNALENWPTRQKEQSVLPINVYSEKPVSGPHSSDNIHSFMQVKEKQSAPNSPESRRPRVSCGTLRKWGCTQRRCRTQDGATQPCGKRKSFTPSLDPVPLGFCVAWFQGVVTCWTAGQFATNLYNLPGIPCLLSMWWEPV